jgi:hypothetical protein
LNDPGFKPKDLKRLERDIHASKPLLICADLANGSKHLVPKRPKVSFSFGDGHGIHFDQKKDISNILLYCMPGPQ